MVNVNIKPAVTEVIEPEKIVLELDRDEAEAVLALVGFNSDGMESEIPTGDIYVALRNALGYPRAGMSKYVAEVSSPGWSTVIKHRR